MASQASAIPTVIDPEAATIDALSQAMDRLTRMMEEGLEHINHTAHQAASMTLSSASTTSTTSLAYAAPTTASPASATSTASCGVSTFESDRVVGRPRCERQHHDAHAFANVLHHDSSTVFFVHKHDIGTGIDHLTRPPP
ncbi:hypothetical protein U9M48_035508 [Paspalum notatum var. saurae]|uniref:Uncharacterized protein n=1 Tax=Paspalum notatum var. saurae TaxID=547442 RepID=A0AAQ3UH66_PASNO